MNWWKIVRSALFITFGSLVGALLGLVLAMIAVGTYILHSGIAPKTLAATHPITLLIIAFGLFTLVYFGAIIFSCFHVKLKHTFYSSERLWIAGMVVVFQALLGLILSSFHPHITFSSLPAALLLFGTVALSLRKKGQREHRGQLHHPNLLK